MANAQSLPSAPERQLDAPVPSNAEAAAYSSSALPSSLTPAALRGEAAGMAQFGRGVIFIPVPAPPPPPQFSAPTALGMVIGGTIGGVVGFNRGSGADRPAGAVAGIVLGGIAGALVGHIYNDVHTRAVSHRGQPGRVCHRHPHRNPCQGKPCNGGPLLEGTPAADSIGN